MRPAFEDFDFTAKRSITKAEIKEIYTLGWLNDARPLLLIGETGVGKTFIAQAVGLHACASGKSVLYMSITALQENLAIARSGGTYLRYRAKLAKFDLIIFDEMGMRKFTATEAQDLCEIIEERSIDKSIDRFYFPTPRGPLQRSHPRCRHLRRHPGPPGTLGAHRQHHRRHLSRGQSQKTCLKEKGRVELSNRGSAGNPCKVGPFTRNRAGPLREIVHLKAEKDTMKDNSQEESWMDRRTFILASAATMATSSVAAASKSPQFPQGFLWGAATAGHQVEGNNTNSDVWAMEHAHPTAYVEPSGDAANSFALWPTDLDLVRSMGLNTYRFSLEWARIEPEPGEFSIAMLDHYKAMIEGCRTRGLTPVVTFNHFTTPIWFAAAGGWANPSAPSVFARYCERAARHLAAQIGYATTLNEPNLSGVLAIVLPPGIGEKLMAGDRETAAAAARAHGVPSFLAGNALWVPEPEKVQANLLAGHHAGREAIKTVRPDLPVGVSLAIIDDQAFGSNSLRDTMRAKLYGRWLEAARGNDFIGVQNYERAVWNDKGKLPPPPNSDKNDMGSEIYPASLAGVVRYAYTACGAPVFVTEHGVNAADDRIRQRLIPAALAELQKAIDEGVPVKGYLHWSLIDNYEWGFGYKPRFGLHTLDRTTFARTPKPSAAVFGGIARRNAL